MPKPTKIGIFGGNEFQNNCRETDKKFCNLFPHKNINVLIIPTAATKENPNLAAQNGITHFNKLGVSASALMLTNKVQSNDKCFLVPINSSSLIYLTGGDPRYLHSILKDSQALVEIKKTLSAGTILIGSSAGAMAMGKYMLFNKLEPGLDLIPNTIIVPHFENHNDVNHLATLSLDQNIDILGLETQAACVTENDYWITLGNKKITLINKGTIREYSQNETKIPLKFESLQ